MNLTKTKEFSLPLGEEKTVTLDQLPHLLIAGSTGSGKSTFIHAILAHIIRQYASDEVKLMLVDPKQVELSIYGGIPHLYDPSLNPDSVRPITNPEHAAVSLRLLIKVMEERYDLMREFKVRNITAFNSSSAKNGELHMPRIVVIIDELAELMATGRGHVETSIQRLAQMGRTAGIHLIVATQRPSVDVITGTIKANFPSRVAFRVATKTDSRVIIDQPGAEKLAGRGAGLFMTPGRAIESFQGLYTPESDLRKLVSSIQGPSDYTVPDSIISIGHGKMTTELERVIEFAVNQKTLTAEKLKQRFGNSARAAYWLSELEMRGFIYKPPGSQEWTVSTTRIRRHLNKEFGD